MVSSCCKPCQRLNNKNGKGFNRPNLVYMRKFYLAFPILGTLSPKLAWSLYFELLKTEDISCLTISSNVSELR